MYEERTLKYQVCFYAFELCLSNNTNTLIEHGKDQR